MSFYKTEELKLLDSYPINKSITLFNYMKDFVFTNPLNFPYSTTIMRNSKSADKVTPADFYTELQVESDLKFLGSKYNSKDDNSFYDALVNRNLSFTSIAFELYKYQWDTSWLIVHKHSPDILITISDGRSEYYAMIDANANAILVYKNSDIPHIYDCLNNCDCHTVKDISDNLDVNHYFYGFNNDRISKEANMLAFISCFVMRDIPSWYYKDLDYVAGYNFFQRVNISEINLLKLTDQNSGYLEEALVTVDSSGKNNNIYHGKTQVVSFDGMNLQINKVKE